MTGPAVRQETLQWEILQQWPSLFYLFFNTDFTFLLFELFETIQQEQYCAYDQDDCHSNNCAHGYQFRRSRRWGWNWYNKWTCWISVNNHNYLCDYCNKVYLLLWSSSVVIFLLLGSCTHRGLHLTLRLQGWSSLLLWRSEGVSHLYRSQHWCLMAGSTYICSAESEDLPLSQDWEDSPGLYHHLHSAQRNSLFTINLSLIT